MVPFNESSQLQRARQATALVAGDHPAIDHVLHQLQAESRPPTLSDLGRLDTDIALCIRKSLAKWGLVKLDQLLRSGTETERAYTGTRESMTSGAWRRARAARLSTKPGGSWDAPDSRC